jgi:hypothetical protein
MMRRSIIFLAVSLALAGGTLRAQSSVVPNEFDPLVAVDVDLTKRLRLDMAFGREHDPDLGSDKLKISGGASMRFRSLWDKVLNDADRDKHHALVVAAFYEFSRSAKQGSVIEENRLTLDGTPRYLFSGPKVLMSNRSRFEFRWVNGTYHFRYRNRLRFERQFSAGKIRFTPYVSEEPYWDSKYSRWSQFRTAVGTQVPVSKLAALDLYYERQHCVTCSDTQLNIFGLTLNIHLNKK